MAIDRAEINAQFVCQILDPVVIRGWQRHALPAAFLHVVLLHIAELTERQGPHQ